MSPQTYSHPSSHRRWPHRRFAALFLVLFAALAVTSTSISLAVAEDGQQRPAKPAGLQVTTEAGSLDVSVDWDDVDGAASYLVRWRAHGPEQELNEGMEVETSEAAITVDNHGDWVVRVEACNDAGCGPGAARRFKVEAAKESTPEPDKSVPDQPAGLKVTTEEGSLDVSVDWDDVEGAASYLVRWREAGPNNSLNDGITVQASNAAVTVAAHGGWLVRVEACNDTGCGKYASQSFTVAAAPEPTPTPEPASEPDSEPATRQQPGACVPGQVEGPGQRPRTGGRTDRRFAGLLHPSRNAQQ